MSPAPDELFPVTVGRELWESFICMNSTSAIKMEIVKNYVKKVGEPPGQ